MLGAVGLGGDHTLQLDGLGAAERRIGNNVERDQCATVAADLLQRLRGDKDAHGTAGQVGARDGVVACLAVGQVKQILAVLLLDGQPLGQIDVGLQGGVGHRVVQHDLDLLGLAGFNFEIVDIKAIGISCWRLIISRCNGYYTACLNILISNRCGSNHGMTYRNTFHATSTIIIAFNLGHLGFGRCP